MSQAESEPNSGDEPTFWRRFFHGVSVTAIFELTRSLTWGRIATAGVLALFPVFMLVLILVLNGVVIPTEQLIGILLLLILQLALLLWASPVVYSELEGRTWIYLASRPYGSVTTVMGKTAVAIFWSYMVSWIALTLCVLVISNHEHPRKVFQIWGGFSILLFLGSLAYASMFALIGTIFHRRAMVFCVVFAAGSIFAGLFDAIIGKLSVFHHLVSLSADLLGILQEEELAYFNSQPIWGDVLGLLIITAIGFGGIFATLRMREYITADEA